jgi:GNAT superfamily N-acetyltransferase
LSIAMPSRPIELDGAVKVRAFVAEDEPGVLEVLQAAFGQWPSGIHDVAPNEFFRWKHVDGPFGPSILLVAEADGAVVGFAAYMPWRFRASEQVVMTARGVDFAVHPSHRRRGVSVALIQAAARHCSENVAFIWSNPNEKIRPGSLRSGRHQVGRFPHFIRPRGPLPGAIKRAWGGGSRMPGHLQIEAEPAAEILRDGADASLPLARTKPPGDRLATVKDLTYLRWRYGRFEEYRAVQADAGTDGGGMAIFRPRRHGPLWVSHVCELFVEGNDVRLARRLLRKVRDAAPADFLSCSFPSRHAAALCGFVQYDRGPAVTTYPLHTNLTPDPTERASWSMSIGDLELL